MNMVRAGEESGKLSETFSYLADYLDRSYDIVSKVENALVYPMFVIAVFFGVMALMLTLVIPKISAVLLDSGQAIPIYTRIVIGFQTSSSTTAFSYLSHSSHSVSISWQLGKTEHGKLILDSLKLSVPYVGDLYKSSISLASQTISPRCFSPAFPSSRRLPSPARSLVMPHTKWCLPKWERM